MERSAVGMRCSWKVFQPATEDPEDVDWKSSLGHVWSCVESDRLSKESTAHLVFCQVVSPAFPGSGSHQEHPSC